VDDANCPSSYKIYAYLFENPQGGNYNYGVSQNSNLEPYPPLPGYPTPTPPPPPTATPTAGPTPTSPPTGYCFTPQPSLSSCDALCQSLDKTCSNYLDPPNNYSFKAYNGASCSGEAYCSCSGEYCCSQDLNNFDPDPVSVLCACQ